ncbi:putative sensor and regulator, histidine kinase and CheY-like receiver domains [Microbacterium sp. HM58-2]|nr:putative sensor and regulator, histidine kinase and CheY-like receiver domains [Microbacterium sp. HM58-2]
MLVATLALGATTLSLLGPAAASAPPTPTPTPESTADSGGRTQTVRGIEVVTRSDIEFGDYAMSDLRDGVYTLLVAPMSWSDQTSGIDASFDITAYDAEGRIVNRNPASTYILPGQEGFFQGIFNEDLSDVVRITVEQTRVEIGPPLMTGGIELTYPDTLGSDRRFYVGGNLTSTLSIAPISPDLFFAGYVDGELFGYCSDIPDIPAGGEFVSTCELIPVTRDEHLLDDRIPKDAEFRAYLELDPIAHEDY